MTDTDTTTASLGLMEAVTGLIDRLHPESADGDPDYRAVLQPLRNGWGIGVALLVPVGSQPMAHTVADWFANGGIAGLVFAPLGGVLMAVVVVWLGSHAPGALGAILGAVRALAVRGTTGALALMRSRWGWLITRPLVWALILGVLIVIGRPIVRILTGA
ncbi:hypothetical protein ADL27_56905 [Streptomyces sp. NRRL F-6602]|nr:hypothetical protein ADL27_56905 [Streptomyces sp. NRRL F-6602]